MNGKIWYFLAAAALFVSGFYEAYEQAFYPMWICFAAMGVFLGIALRGRNTWMM